MAAHSSRTVESATLGMASARPNFPGLARTSRPIARGIVEAIASTGGTTQVIPGEIRSISFAEWKVEMGQRIAVTRFYDRAINGELLLSVPPPLIASLIDKFYGGTGTIEVSPRPIGMADQHLLERISAAVGDAIVAAWAAITPLAPSVVGSTFASEELAFGRTDDVVIVQAFTTDDTHAGRGSIEIVYPLATLRGIPALRQLVEPPLEAVNPAWRSRLSDAVMQSRLPVRTVIARPTLPLSHLIALAPGDFIPVTLPARVPLTVAGRLMAHGTIGEANGRAAIKIDKLEQGVSFDD